MSAHARQTRPSEPDSFRKSRAAAPDDFFRWEAAGLRWLADAERGGGARAVRVREVAAEHIVLERIRPTAPTVAAASELGRALAATHATGAAGFGAGPPGWRGDGFIGRQRLPIKHFDRWGEFYARARLLPYARAAQEAGTLTSRAAHLVDLVCAQLVDGKFDDGRPTARIHGDLWGGNVLYMQAAAGPRAVLIDPAAHGGHGQTDLAMLELFGTPHLRHVQQAYADAAGLPADWAELTALHQLHPLLVHAVTHGPGYGEAAEAAARRYV